MKKRASGKTRGYLVLARQNKRVFSVGAASGDFASWKWESLVCRLEDMFLLMEEDGEDRL